MHLNSDLDSTKTAIVTGASRGIGLALAGLLLNHNYRVYGISRTNSKLLEHPNFTQIRADLSDLSSIQELVAKLETMSLKDLDLLINNAGIGYFEPHEELSVSKIQQMVTLNLTAPLILTNKLLRPLKNSAGMVIFISSVSALKSSHLGAAYSATKAGLTHFSKCLFDETRKSGLRCSVIHPDMVETNFFDNHRFGPKNDPDTVLESNDISAVLEFLINQRVGVVIPEITIRQQRLQLIKK